jgi:adenylylsulfate kinase
VSWAIWITGLPGSGKSVLARQAARRLQAAGEPVTVLELDEIRKVVTPSPRYSDTEREVVYHGLAHMAAVLTGAGVRVIVDATAHRRDWRTRARAAIPRFAEVQLCCPLDVCRQREAVRRDTHAPRGIYAKAGLPGARVPGMDVVYEPALSPELTLDTGRLEPWIAAQEIVALARTLEGGSPPRPAWPSRPGCVVWIHGRPGSGKTTLARGVARALSRAKVATEVLELTAFQRALLPAKGVCTATEEVMHRVFIWTAKILADQGLVVIVDATTPRRAWRDLARCLIPSFAEVQLVCPAEVSAEREQAVRWRGPCDPTASPASWAAGPEICLDYEESPAPELTLNTHVVGRWSAVWQVVALARRLLRPKGGYAATVGPGCAREDELGVDQSPRGKDNHHEGHALGHQG